MTGYYELSTLERGQAFRAAYDELRILGDFVILIDAEAALGRHGIDDARSAMIDRPGENPPQISVAKHLKSLCIARANRPPQDAIGPLQ